MYTLYRISDGKKIVCDKQQLAAMLATGLYAKTLSETDVGGAVADAPAQEEAKQEPSPPAKPPKPPKAKNENPFTEQ